jgi:hypothetical protein
MLYIKKKKYTKINNKNKREREREYNNNVNIIYSLYI